jgi:hypothetical protein
LILPTGLVTRTNLNCTYTSLIGRNNNTPRADLSCFVGYGSSKISNTMGDAGAQNKLGDSIELGIGGGR